MTELRFTWAELKLIAEWLGLADEDPEPTAAMILAMLDTRVTIAAEFDHVRLFGLDDDDGPD
jgi:hypothetical protein